MNLTPNADLHYASIGARGLALILDYLLLSAHFFPITRFVKGTWMMTSTDHIWNGIFDPICLVFLIIIIAYFILWEGLASTTPGKALLRIKIVTYEMQPISMKQSLLRFAGRLVDGIGANLTGVVIMLCNPRRQRMGDIWAKTLVVKRKPKKKYTAIPRR